MTEITLTLDKEGIITEVRRITAYEGYRGAGSDEAYVKDFVRDEDTEALERYYAEAYARLRGVANEYVVGEPIDTSGTEQTIELHLPDNYNEALASTMQTLATQYMVESIVADWYSLVEKENAQPHAAAASDTLTVIRGSLYKRKRPQRTNQ